MIWLLIPAVLLALRIIGPEIGWAFALLDGVQRTHTLDDIADEHEERTRNGTRRWCTADLRCYVVDGWHVAVDRERSDTVAREAERRTGHRGHRTAPCGGMRWCYECRGHY